MNLQPEYINGEDISSFPEPIKEAMRRLFPQNKGRTEQQQRWWLVDNHGVPERYVSEPGGWAEHLRRCKAQYSSRIPEKRVDQKVKEVYIQKVLPKSIELTDVEDFTSNYNCEYK